MLATIIISALLLLAVVLIVRHLVVARKNRQSGCSCGCEGCTVKSTSCYNDQDSPS
jgi:hypothetical protein